MKAIIFDFDGVIHDTFEFHRGMLNEFAGVNLSVQEFKDIHNGNFFNNVPDSISGINWDDYKNYIYSDISSFVINNETKDILYELKQNFQLFVISSGGTKNITDYLRIIRYFQFLRKSWVLRPINQKLISLILFLNRTNFFQTIVYL